MERSVCGSTGIHSAPGSDSGGRESLMLPEPCMGQLGSIYPLEMFVAFFLLFFNFVFLIPFLP